MVRFIIIIIIGYILVRILKVVFGTSQELKRGPDGGVIDEMVQDPFCKKYIPMRGRETVKRVIGGQQHFFCSNDCADKFEAEK